MFTNCTLQITHMYWNYTFLIRKIEFYIMLLWICFLFSAQGEVENVFNHKQKLRGWYGRAYQSTLKYFATITILFPWQVREGVKWAWLYEWITTNELKEYEYVDSAIRQTKASPGNTKECLSQDSFVRQSVRVPWPGSQTQADFFSRALEAACIVRAAMNIHQTDNEWKTPALILDKLKQGFMWQGSEQNQDFLVALIWKLKLKPPQSMTFSSPICLNALI